MTMTSSNTNSVDSSTSQQSAVNCAGVVGANNHNILWPNCPNGCHDACSLANLSVYKAQVAGVSLPGRFRVTMRRVHGSLHQQLLLNRSVRWLCQRLLLGDAGPSQTCIGAVEENEHSVYDSDPATASAANGSVPIVTEPVYSAVTAGVAESAASV